ncbi:MAG: hypothetical protein ABI221_02355 [Candidatus Saccharimonadales bacterium]
MIRRRVLAVIVLAALGLLIVVPHAARADQASNKTITSVINNPTDVIVPPVDPNPPGDTTVITGSSAPSTTIKIINNGRFVAHTQTNPDGTFTVTVPLQDGRNVISIQRPGSSASKPITITRTPAWWRHWGKRLTCMLAAILLLAFILWLIRRLWIGGRKKALLVGEEDDKDDDDDQT